MLNYIPDDGYTERAYVAARPGLHDELRFAYRPMLIEARSRIVERLESLRADVRDLRVAESLAEQLVEWNLCDARQRPIAISVDVCRRLKPALFYRLWNIVLGTESGDVDPQQNLEGRLQQARDQYDAAGSPTPIGEQKEERAEKNSVAA